MHPVEAGVDGVVPVQRHLAELDADDLSCRWVWVCLGLGLVSVSEIGSVDFDLHARVCRWWVFNQNRPDRSSVGRV